MAPVPAPPASVVVPDDAPGVAEDDQGNKKRSQLKEPKEATSSKANATKLSL